MSYLNPFLNPHTYVFCTTKELLPDDIEALGMFHEQEGTTYIIKVDDAEKHNFKFEGKWRWISLRLVSALNSVGFTAAFSKALTEENISCNVIAAHYHDHIFVPEKRASEAVSILEKITI